jgi:tRNA/tmRNA/rRNA uracil-C5-methylase (TrmA/RlmC/RlmD family)
MLFAELIQDALQPQAGSRRRLAMEPLVHLKYGAELAAKNQALSEFWKGHRLPLAPTAIIAAPLPRHYRTTTRRQAVYHRGHLSLVALQEDGTPTTHAAAASQLEPAEHATLYHFLAERLNEVHFRPLASVLNFAIIRGSYTERTVIFNVCELDGTIVRKLKMLAALLPDLDRAIVSAFMFFDPSRSRYYLDSRQEVDGVKTKKLYGPGVLVVNFHGNRYLYSPTGFTQVNEAMVPRLLSAVQELLCPAPTEHLIDLYCGYGLFTHFLASSYAHALGLDAAPESIEAAQQNTRFFPPGNRVAFRVSRIEGEGVAHQLPRPDGHAEALLADPPRQGLPTPVIVALAGRAPTKVVQACCGIDEVPRQILAWQANGYRLTAVVPLDLFPGTPHLETLLSFVPDRQAP